jgi:mannose-6-phosphate isomerase-like protein (cupin superfamily)
MAKYQAFEFETLADQAGTKGPYRELMRRPGFSMGIYHLTAGGEDHQHPHESDEVYIVQSGRAVLRVEGEDYPVGPGSVVSVDRGAEHGFTEIAEDLTLLVMFAPPEVPEA